MTAKKVNLFLTSDERNALRMLNKGIIIRTCLPAGRHQ